MNWINSLHLITFCDVWEYWVTRVTEIRLWNVFWCSMPVNWYNFVHLEMHVSFPRGSWDLSSNFKWTRWEWSQGLWNCNGNGNGVWISNWQFIFIALSRLEMQASNLTEVAVVALAPFWTHPIWRMHVTCVKLLLFRAGWLKKYCCQSLSRKQPWWPTEIKT